MSRKVIIVGGVAGGATAAARARRLDEDAQIVLFERGEHISFANCGLPYHIGGEIENRDSLLLHTPQSLGARFNLDVRVRHEVVSIDRAKKTVSVRDLAADRLFEESYDQLVLAPGAAPIRPPLPGVDGPRVFTLRNVPDTDRIRAAIDDGARRALVVGGGFIGLELAENLQRRGLQVTLVELLPQVLPPLDPELAKVVAAELQAHGVALHLEDAVTAFEDTGKAVRAQLKSGATLEADLVVLAVGVRPDSKLAVDAGLTCTDRGAIVVDDRMCTSDPAIYAVGDAVQVRDFVLDQPTVMPLAGPANRQARIAVDNIFGRNERFRGVQGTSIVRVFSRVAATTGASEKLLARAGRPFRKIYVVANQHVAYFPGATPMLLKLLFAPDDGRVLGAQIVGGEGVDTRIDVLAIAIQGRMTVQDLAEAELAYAPQFGAAKDPINMLGFVASNALSGDMRFVYPEEVADLTADGWTLVDVRNPDEVAAFRVPEALCIPLHELRARLAEIPAGRQIATICASGQRSYYAARILQQRGFQSADVTGGARVFGITVPQAPCGRPV